MEKDVQVKILAKLEAQERQIEAITHAVRVMRRFAMWRLILLVLVLVVLPVIGITIALPKLNESLQSIINAVTMLNQGL